MKKIRDPHPICRRSVKKMTPPYVENDYPIRFSNPWDTVYNATFYHQWIFCHNKFLRVQCVILLFDQILVIEMGSFYISKESLSMLKTRKRQSLSLSLSLSLKTNILRPSSTSRFRLVHVQYFD